MSKKLSKIGAANVLALGLFYGLGALRGIHFHPEDDTGGGDDDKKLEEEKKANASKGKKKDEGDPEEKKYSRKTELEGRLMTDKERSDNEKAKLEGEYKAKLDTESGEKKKALSLFETATIKRAITDAALEHRVFNAKQLVKMLERDVKLVKIEGSEGDKPEDFEAVIEVTGKNEKTGKFEKTQVTVAKYVESLKSNKEYDNLFISERVGGSGYRPGGGGQGGGGGGDASPTAKISRGLRASGLR